MDKDPVKRIPIKIRHTISREYCTCFNAPVLSIGGVPYLIVGDRLTIKDLERFLDTVSVSTSMYFSSIDHLDKAQLCLSRKLPVAIRTNKVLPSGILDQMADVPHSAIHVSIKFLDDFLRSRLEKDGGKVDDIFEMMHLSKSRKIFLALQMEYFPHLLQKLDAFNIVDTFKNLVNHILLSFPQIPDEEYRDNYHLWESLKMDSVDRFKKMYEPHVPQRSWSVKFRYRSEILSDLVDFVKSKRISVEAIDISGNGDRIRRPWMNNKLPLGIRPFMYRNNGEFFVEEHVEDENPCPTCGKTIFL